MRPLIIGLLAVTAITLIVREMAGKIGPAMRARCAEVCERMLANMPSSFPPNRMMADLEVLKERTARILDLVDPQTDDLSTRSRLPREPHGQAPVGRSVAGVAHNVRLSTAKAAREPAKSGAFGRPEAAR